MKKRKHPQPVIKPLVIIIAATVILNYFIENTSVFYRKSFLLPFALHLNKQELVLVKGEESHLYLNGINKRVFYYSTNFRVAGANFNGRVFAYRTGKAFIIAKTEKKKLKCRVYVIDINKEKITLSVGSSDILKMLGPVYRPKWKSSCPDVASVNRSGMVTGKSRGTAIITGKWKGKIVKCQIHVVKERE